MFVRFREMMVLSDDGALAVKVVADSHSVVDLHEAGGARVAIALLGLWLRLRDLPIRVLEFINMVVPHNNSSEFISRTVSLITAPTSKVPT